MNRAVIGEQKAAAFENGKHRADFCIRAESQSLAVQCRIHSTARPEVQLRRLMRKRGEFIERSFAHCYDTGGMRRTHLRKHENILKRLLIHVAGFNLSLILRQLLGLGTARGLQGLAARVVGLWDGFWAAIRRSISPAALLNGQSPQYRRYQLRAA